MMRGAIHFFLTLAFVQSPLLPDPAKAKNTPQYISGKATASAPTAAPGTTLTLFLDVTPNPGIHVYAPGNEEYLPIALSLRLPAGAVTAGEVVYPRSEKITFEGESVPVYRKPFRLEQEITVAATAKAGSTLTVAGVVNYQACDDRICFKPTTLPVSWNVKIR